MDIPKQQSKTRPGTDCWFEDQAVSAAHVHTK